MTLVRTLLSETRINLTAIFATFSGVVCSALFAGASKIGYKYVWWDDRNTTKRVEYKKICIAANNLCSIPINGEFEEFIIFRVTTVSNNFGDVDHMSIANEHIKKLNSFVFGYIPIKLLPSNNRVKFVA